MGRGYSLNRSASARPTNKGKRVRSVSLAKLSKKMEVVAQKAQSKEEYAQAMKELEDDDDVELSEDEDETVRRQDVLTKYKICGTVTDEAVATVAKACLAGASNFDLCKLGDEFVMTKVKGMFQKNKSETGERMKKGLAFPTTVSVNNVLCNASPQSEAEATTLRNGDIVKIAVAVHLDGYPTTSAVTIVVGADSGAITSLDAETANVMAATHYAMQGMLRLVKPGMENQDVTDFIMHVGKIFGVEPVEGVLSNRTKRWILDGNEAIIARRVLTEEPQQNIADCVIGEHQVWTLDVAFTSSPSYRMKALPVDNNIFRRNDITVIPRLAAAQEAVAEIRDTYMCFPFCPLRMKAPLRTRLGLTELKKHGMLDFFPTLGSAKGSITARHSCTVAVTAKRVNIISGAPAEALPDLVASATTKQPSPDMMQLLAEELTIGDAKPMKKKNAAPKTQEAAATAAVADEDDDNDNTADLPSRTRKTHRSGV